MGYTEQETDVMLRCLDLSDTLGQGLQYVKNQLDGGQYEHGIQMLSEVINGFLAIERGLNNLEALLAGGSYTHKTDSMVQALEQVGDAASAKQWLQCSSLLVEKLLPAYQDWQSVLRQSLEPAISS